MANNTSKKKLIINTLIYSLSGILLKCFNFFLLPVYTSFLTTKDYGVTSVSQSFVSTFGFVISLSLFSAVLRFFVDYKNDEEILKRFYGSVCLFVFITSASMLIISYIFRDALLKYLFAGVNDYSILYLSIGILIFYCQQEIYLNILKSQQKAFKISILSICFFFITLIFNIIFVIILHLGAKGSLLATLLSNIIYAIYFLFDMGKHNKIKLCLDFKLLKDALKYSIPIIPHNISTHIAVLFSKIFIGSSVSLSGVGIYAIASQFGNIADTIQVYVDNAYGPWLYENIKSQNCDLKKNIHIIVRLILSVLGFFFIGIALFAQDYIFLFIDEAYADAWKYVPFIVMTFIVKSVYYFYVEILFYYKEASRKLFIATLSSSIINIILSYIFIPLMNIYGSILADFISMIIRVGIVIYISRKYDDVGLRLKEFILNFVLVSMFILLGLSLSYVKFANHFTLTNFMFKCLIIITYLILIYFLNRTYINPYINKFKDRIIRSKN